MKTVFIEQAFGLGDVIFSQGIIDYFIDSGIKDIIWPVEDQFYDDCCAAYSIPKFIPLSLIRPEFMDVKDKREIGNIIMAPIRWSDTFMKVPYKHVMRAKYDMYEMNWRNWKLRAKWHRNISMELELMNILGIDKSDKYNLVNPNFSGSGRQVSIETNNSFRNIEMKKIPGFTIFDWTMVIEFASEIHTVSTSILYMLEMLELTMPIHLYCRKPIETDFSFVDYLFTKPYILHY